MKKTVIFVVLAMVLIGSCTAQSTTADQRIVGTWTNEGSTLVFNANGTETIEQGTEKWSLFYGISASGDIFIRVYDSRNRSETISDKLFFSPDGRRMFISFGRDTEMYQKK